MSLSHLLPGQLERCLQPAEIHIILKQAESKEGAEASITSTKMESYSCEYLCLMVPGC